MTALGRKLLHPERTHATPTRRTANAAVLVLALILLLLGVGLYGALWSGLLTAMRSAL